MTVRLRAALSAHTPHQWYCPRTGAPDSDCSCNHESAVSKLVAVAVMYANDPDLPDLWMLGR